MLYSFILFSYSFHLFSTVAGQWDTHPTSNPPVQRLAKFDRFCLVIDRIRPGNHRAMRRRPPPAPVEALCKLICTGIAAASAGHPSSPSFRGLLERTSELGSINPPDECGANKHGSWLPRRGSYGSQRVCFTGSRFMGKIWIRRDTPMLA